LIAFTKLDSASIENIKFAAFEAVSREHNVSVEASKLAKFVGVMPE
jgi:hypothetical protein